MLKRGYYGTFHHMSPKHIQRYADEFAGRLNTGHDTMELVRTVVRGVFGKRLPYKELVGSRRFPMPCVISVLDKALATAT